MLALTKKITRTPLKSVSTLLERPPFYCFLQLASRQLDCCLRRRLSAELAALRRPRRILKFIRLARGLMSPVEPEVGQACKIQFGLASVQSLALQFSDRLLRPDNMNACAEFDALISTKGAGRLRDCVRVRSRPQSLGHWSS